MIQRTLKTIAALLLIPAMLAGGASYNYTDASPTMGVMYSRYAYIGYEGEASPSKTWASSQQTC